MNDIDRLNEENHRLRQWISDLQSGMYINCVYCGHRYGPDDQVPASMADALKEHIEVCPEHPMSKLKQELDMLKRPLTRDELLMIAEIVTDEKRRFFALYNTEPNRCIEWRDVQTVETLISKIKRGVI